MNQHLNLFKFFNQEQSTEHIENNLSRALVLNLRHNALLFHKIIKAILQETDNGDYDYLFANSAEDDKAEINIQVNVTELNETEFRRIYAIATTPVDWDMSDFFKYQCKEKDRNHITDITITIKDIIFIFEVKRWAEDCRQQLYNQVYKLSLSEDNHSETVLGKNLVVPISFSWKKIMSLVIKANNFNDMVGKPDIFLKDFISLVQQFNVNWLPVTPFANIGADPGMNDKRNQRLFAAINQVKNIKILEAMGRHGFELNFGWAKEILFWFERDSSNKLSLKMYIWPGNTKGQGWKVYYNPKLEHIYDHKSVAINGKTFQVKVENEVKFCHFNKYITELDFKNTNIKKDIMTTANFEKYAGKHNRSEWHKLEDFFNEHFKEEFNWKEASGWQKHFVESNRSYLTLSLGFQISVEIPYDYLQEIDTKEDDYTALTNLFEKVHDYFKTLL